VGDWFNGNDFDDVLFHTMSLLYCWQQATRPIVQFAIHKISLPGIS